MNNCVRADFFLFIILKICHCPVNCTIVPFAIWLQIRVYNKKRRWTGHSTARFAFIDAICKGRRGFSAADPLDRHFMAGYNIEDGRL